MLKRQQPVDDNIELKQQFFIPNVTKTDIREGVGFRAC